MSEPGVSTPAPEPSGRPSRHQRSMAGMIGAMLITLVVIGGFVLLRGSLREQTEVEVPPALCLLGCFHPSQQNTFTGVLTEPMIDAVLLRARAIADLGAI